jgi:hypothetical protein
MEPGLVSPSSVTLLRTCTQSDAVKSDTLYSARYIYSAHIPITDRVQADSPEKLQVVPSAN